MGRGQPYGGADWGRRTAKEPGLELPLRLPFALLSPLAPSYGDTNQVPRCLRISLCVVSSELSPAGE